MGLSENIKKLMEEALGEAHKELKDYPVMPEHYSTMLKHQNMDARGYYSEIDMDIDARLKRCDIYAERRDTFQQAMYQHVRKEIETKAANLKEQMKQIAKEHRLYTRAARLCTDKEAKESLLQEADKLKESKAVKDYNLLITGLESYAGIGPYKMENETILGFERLIGYVTNGETLYSGGFRDGYYTQRPEQIKIELQDMDQVMEQFKLSHPGIKEKTEEERDKLFPSYELFLRTVDKYALDNLEDTLNSCFQTMDERLNLLIIDGQTLGEIIEEKEGKKERTKEELQALSCSYLNGALRNGSRVEAFMPEAKDATGTKYYDKTVPVVSSKPKERVTMKFWERWLSKIGFFKDKAERYEEQKKMDEKMEACKKRVKEKMSQPLTREEKAVGKMAVRFSAPMTKEQEERLQIGNEIAKETGESFVRDVRCYEKTNGERDKLLYSFFPEEQKSRESVKIEGTSKASRLDRDMPMYYGVAKMLQEKIPFDEILDPTKHVEKRIQIGKELKEKVPVMSEDEFDRMHIDCMKALANEVDKFAEKMGKEIKSSKDFIEKFPQLHTGVVNFYAISMDDFHDKDKAVEYCGGKKEFEDLSKKLETGNRIYDMKLMQKKVMQKYFQVLRGGDGLKIVDNMNNKLSQALVLQGLQSKKPEFISSNVTLSDVFELSTLMKGHPEVKNLQEKADKMDREFLQDWLATDGENQANLKLEFYKEEVTDKTAVENDKAKSFNLKTNVVINNRKMVELKDPVMDEEMGL